MQCFSLHARYCDQPGPRRHTCLNYSNLIRPRPEQHVNRQFGLCSVFWHLGGLRCQLYSFQKVWIQNHYLGGYAYQRALLVCIQLVHRGVHIRHRSLLIWPLLGVRNNLQACVRGHLCKPFPKTNNDVSNPGVTAPRSRLWVPADGSDSSEAMGNMARLF